MSNKKEDKGKLFHKLHQLQKLFNRLISIGKEKDAKIVEKKEYRLIEKLKGRGKY